MFQTLLGVTHSGLVQQNYDVEFSDVEFSIDFRDFRLPKRTLKMIRSALHSVGQTTSNGQQVNVKAIMDLLNEREDRHLITGHCYVNVWHNEFTLVLQDRRSNQYVHYELSFVLQYDKVVRLVCNKYNRY